MVEDSDHRDGLSVLSIEEEVGAATQFPDIPDDLIDASPNTRAAREALGGCDKVANISIGPLPSPSVDRMVVDLVDVPTRGGPEPDALHPS